MSPEGYMNILYPIDNLIPEIVCDANMENGYDYVISHLESKEQRAKYAPDKELKSSFEFASPDDYSAYIARQKYAAKIRSDIIRTLKKTDCRRRIQDYNGRRENYFGT